MKSIAPGLLVLDRTGSLRPAAGSARGCRAKLTRRKLVARVTTASGPGQTLALRPLICQLHRQRSSATVRVVVYRPQRRSVMRHPPRKASPRDVSPRRSAAFRKQDSPPRSARHSPVLRLPGAALACDSARCRRRKALGRVGAGLTSKVSEHGQYTSVIVGGGWELELGEYVCDVFLDRALGDDELLANCFVRASFGH